ncbi:hypothetical protein EDD85DRAFT_575213 [Armillaria nabsnona]|nr:hypothetical protein EDD85DRAFT_575213 [Armillaria nabsnona]
MGISSSPAVSLRFIKWQSPGFHLDFPDFGQSEAVDLLLKHAHEDSDNDNQQLASAIVDALGCQALAVATAGAYIASTATCTLSNYLSLFKRKCKQLLNYKMKSLNGYQKTVFSAFQLSFDQLSSPTSFLCRSVLFFITQLYLLSYSTVQLPLLAMTFSLVKRNL